MENDNKSSAKVNITTGGIPSKEITNGNNMNPTGVVSGDQVQVPKVTLQQLLNRVEKVEEENKVLREASDRARLSNVERKRNQGKLVKNVRLTTIDDEIVLGWKLIKDDVHVEGGKVIEDQTVKIFFRDGKEKEMSLRSFSNNSIKIEGEVVREAKEQDGTIFVDVLLPDGEKIENVNISFIN